MLNLDGVYVDATFGAGHSEYLLSKVKSKKGISMLLIQMRQLLNMQ